MQRDPEGRLLFTSDPDHCCHLNKTQPMDAILMSYDVWINGVRADQSAIRAAMKVEQPAKHGCLTIPSDAGLECPHDLAISKGAQFAKAPARRKRICEYRL